MTGMASRQFRWPLPVLAMLLLWLPMVAMAQTRAWLEQDSIAAGDAVTLHIETDEGAPDYAPLNADFALSAQSSNRQVQWSNGGVQQRNLYTVALTPRRTGTLQVPSLQVGSARTLPLVLQVSDAVVATPQSNATAFIETEVDDPTPYVQQSVGVVVRLYFATQLASGELDLATPASASLQRVGQDRTSARDVGGRRYNVVERRFLLIPERSGPLLLPGARLNGVTGSGFMGFDGERRPVSAAAPAQRLQVLPIPAGAPQPWLPLRGLTLRYLQAPKQAFAGQAASVEIEAVADGATAAQMPEIAIADVPGAQVFAEPAQVDEQFVEGRPRSTVRRTFSLVPTRPGALVVAGPRIAWWDAVNGVARVAELPSLRLQVTPGAKAGAEPDAASPAAQPAQEAVPAAAQSAASRTSDVRDWRGMWIGLLALVAAAVIAFLWGRGRNTARTATKEPPAAPGTPGPSLALALKAGDLAVIAHALAKDAGLATEDLDALRARLADPAQADAVRQLQAARWGGGDVQAALRALRAAFASGARWRQTKQEAKSLLPPLYPE